MPNENSTLQSILNPEESDAVFLEPGQIDEIPVEDGEESDGRVTPTSLIYAIAGENENIVVYGGDGPSDPTDDADLIVVQGEGSAQVFGNGGDDQIAYDAGDGGTIYAGFGDDLVQTTGAEVTVYGGAGRDQITAVASEGDDLVIFGGTGQIDPNDGGDTIQVSGEGSAAVYGNGGDDDIVYTAQGDATIYGGVGDDRIDVQSDGDALIYGGTGSSDRISVQGDGDNTVYGGSSNVDVEDSQDIITVTGNGDNLVFGNGGADVITIVGEGENTVYGGIDDDLIDVSGGGSATIFGGTGADEFRIGQGTYTIEDFDASQGDVLQVGDRDYVATEADGNTTLAFDDGTRIVLTGVTGEFESTQPEVQILF